MHPLSGNAKARPLISSVGQALAAKNDPTWSSSTASFWLSERIRASTDWRGVPSSGLPSCRTPALPSDLAAPRHVFLVYHTARTRTQAKAGPLNTSFYRYLHAWHDMLWKCMVCLQPLQQRLLTFLPGAHVCLSRAQAPGWSQTLLVPAAWRLWPTLVWPRCTLCQDQRLSANPPIPDTASSARRAACSAPAAVVAALHSSQQN